MRKATIIRLSFLVAFLAIKMVVNTKTDSCYEDIPNLIESDGSATNAELILRGIALKMQATNPEILDEKWHTLNNSVFDRTLAELNRQLIPVNKNPFMMGKVKTIIVCYESPKDKNLTEKTSHISKKSMCLSCTWSSF
jgi:hypothetical protein